jgi:type IV secretory pathway component VirB8
MDQETQEKMAGLERKMDEIYASVEKTRKYFLWTMIITVAVIVLPIIGLLFVIPSFLNTTINSLGI